MWARTIFPLRVTTTKKKTFICEFDHQNWVKTKGMIFVHIIGEVHISICNMTDTMRTLIGLKTFFFHQ